MTKNTGMTAKDEAKGKVPHLPEAKAKEVNKMLKEEAKKPAPTATVKAVNDARAKKKNK